MLEGETLKRVSENWQTLSRLAKEHWQTFADAHQVDGDGVLQVSEPTIVVYPHQDGAFSILRLLPASSGQSETEVTTTPQTRNVELAMYYGSVGMRFDTTLHFPRNMRDFLSAPQSEAELKAYLTALIDGFPTEEDNGLSSDDAADGKSTKEGGEPIVATVGLTGSQVNDLTFLIGQALQPLEPSSVSAARLDDIYFQLTGGHHPHQKGFEDLPYHGG